MVAWSQNFFTLAQISKKQVPNHDPEHYIQYIIYLVYYLNAQDHDFAPLFGDLGQKQAWPKVKNFLRLSHL